MKERSRVRIWNVTGVRLAFSSSVESVTVSTTPWMDPFPSLTSLSLFMTCTSYPFCGAESIPCRQDGHTCKSRNPCHHGTAFAKKPRKIRQGARPADGLCSGTLYGPFDRRVSGCIALLFSSGSDGIGEIITDMVTLLKFYPRICNVTYVCQAGFLIRGQQLFELIGQFFKNDLR